MKRLCVLALSCLLILSACQKPIGMTSELNAGEYRVTMLDISPANAEIADNPEFWDIKKLVQPALLQKLPYLGSGKNVGLKITITHVNTSMNAAKMMLIGDSYKIWADIQLWDLQTKRQLGKTKLVVSGPVAGGIGGMIAHGVAVNTMELEQRIADDFVKQLISKLYPERNNSSNNAFKSFMVGN